MVEASKKQHSTGRIYFPGLNALRFFAALFVVFTHIEQFKIFFGVAAPPLIFGIHWMDGGDAVTLFFVVSGFLITYLLLEESRREGEIHIPKFYMRRMLRIWPLYYLLVIIGFFIVPLIVHLAAYEGYYVPLGDEFFQKLFLYVFLLPNASLSTVYVLSPVVLTHLWTIGIEEQFYILWSLLLKVIKRRVLLILTGVIVFRIVVNVSIPIYWAYRPDVPYGLASDFLVFFLTSFRIESMAIGGIGAYLIFNQKERFLSFIFHPVMERAILLAMVVHILFLPAQPPAGDFAISVLYILLILNLTCNKRSKLKFEHPIYTYLGHLSYGIYMYHLTVIYFVMIAFEQLGLLEANRWLRDIPLYLSITVITVVVSALSYKYFESPFLALKARFAVVKSGDIVSRKSRETWLSRLLHRFSLEA